ncbi:TPA: hypothetical protein ACF2DR_001726 [Clostridium perfringens]
MEGNKNLKNNMRISYIIKEMLLQLDKVNGEIPDLEWVENNIVQGFLSEDDYQKIKKIMIKGNLIEGSTIGSIEAGDMKITLEGIRFLLDYNR